MNSATITRKYTDKGTYGRLTAKRGDTTFTCLTLELPWKENKSNISCIPEGTYEANYTFWTRKMRWNYLLKNVPKRSGIFIHWGNYAYKKMGTPDIQGCILLGVSYSDLNNDMVLDITNTTATVKSFQEFMGKEKFILTIKS